MSRPRRSASSLDLPEPLFGSDRRTSSVRRRSVSPGRENASANGRASFAPAKRNARRSISQATLPTDAAVNGDTEVPANEAQVCVAVRVRPFSAKEVAAGSTARRTVSVLDNRKIVFDPLAAKVVDDGGPEGPTFRVPGTRREKNVCYTFDRVFAETATQQEVYEGSAKPLIDAVLGGYNSTVFAYGATGCGKTHTIVGTQEDPGLIVRMMEDLFERMSALEGDRVIEAQFSYLEVYNEIIRDLLMPDAAPAGLDVREDDHGVVVAGLSLHAFSDPTAVMDMLLRGNSNRSKAPTEANQASSRSHAVLQVHIQHKDRASGTHSSWTKAVLSIIDLAGSERASVTKNRGERLHEGAKINRSLLALGNCINALCKPGATAQHVPYRDSKLTRLLKHSLGGNCRVVMIANISPHPMHYEETHNTLMYANRAKQIRTRSEVNRVEVEAGVDQYVKIIADLREQVHSLKQKL
ncbi:P-loop containing nucleoside triphosphate hydrolase protein, partial [Hyaloraphidium curvatum]